MKVNKLLLPCLVGLLALTSCKTVNTKTTTTENLKQETTSQIQSTKETTLTEETDSTHVSNNGAYQDDEDWGELRS